MPKNYLAALVVIVPALLLSAVACLHIRLSFGNRLSAREGGSFGMYAVAERVYIRTFSFNGDASFMFDPEEIHPLGVSKVIHWPSEKHLRTFARELACIQQVRVMYPESHGVRVEYWSGHYTNHALNVKKVESYEATCG